MVAVDGALKRIESYGETWEDGKALYAKSFLAMTD